MAIWETKETENPYRLPPHLEILNQHLCLVALRRIRRLAVFMPPRHGKSWLCSHYFPAWYLGTYPERKIILTSYAAELAHEGSSKARDLLIEFGAQLFQQTIRPDKKAAHNWKIEGTAGACFAGGLLGGLTGRGADVLIVDDPISGPMEASSKAIREFNATSVSKPLRSRLKAITLPIARLSSTTNTFFRSSDISVARSFNRNFDGKSDIHDGDENLLNH